MSDEELRRLERALQETGSEEACLELARGLERAGRRERAREVLLERLRAGPRAARVEKAWRALLEPLPEREWTWSEGGGVRHLVGPTAGYLVGFAVAATVVGFLAERGWDRSPLSAAAAMIVGNLVIYAVGIAWLGSLIGTLPALQAGLLPFLVGDAIKVALGAALLPLAWAALRRRE